MSSSWGRRAASSSRSRSRCREIGGRGRAPVAGPPGSGLAHPAEAVDRDRGQRLARREEPGVKPRAGRAALRGLSAAPLLLLALSAGAGTAGAAGQRSQRAPADETVFLTNMGTLTLAAGPVRGTHRCAGCAPHSLPTVSGDGYVQFRAADV